MKWTSAAMDFWKHYNRLNRASEKTQARIKRRAEKIARDRGAKRLGRKHILLAISPDEND
jgi:hypothetical protein